MLLLKKLTSFNRLLDLPPTLSSLHSVIVANQAYDQQGGRKKLLLHLQDQQIDFLQHPKLGLYENFTFYTAKLERINPMSPTSVLLQDFFFRKDNALFYVISDPQFNYMRDSGSSYLGSKLLPFTEGSAPAAALVEKILKNLSPEGQHSGTKVKMGIMQALVEQGREASDDRKILDHLLNKVTEMGIHLKELRESQVVKLRRKQLFRLKLMFGLYGLQFIGMHYFIYFALSWDIMEPVACLLGLLDVNIAILYALVHGQDYSYQTIYDRKTKQTRSVNELDLLIYQNEQVHKFLLRRKLLLGEDFESAVKGVGMGTAPLGLIGQKLEEEQN